MRVLVACEFSGVVRDAFRAAGHDAVSVDLLPSERPGPHIQGDVRAVLGDGWDLMVAHPPCTYLANSGVRWLYTGEWDEDGQRVLEAERWVAMDEGAEFFAALLTAPIPRVAVENPVMHGHARERIAHHVRELVRAGMAAPTQARVQTIQPWQFGHGEVKATQLWLRGLPELRPTDVVEGREARVHRMAPSPTRWAERSRTYEGIARAMAEQWGGL